MTSEKIGDTTADSAHEVGARWWSLDIHAHSPASFDYGGLDGEKNDKPKPSFKEWIRTYMDAGVNGIVIADHNTHEGIAPARAALAELLEDDPSLPQLTLFPGVELTVTGGTHLLAIFDPGSADDIVLAALTKCNFNGERGRSDHTANVTVERAAKEIVELGGLCVPAHVDKAAGLKKMDDRELAQLAKCKYVVAVEIVEDDQETWATVRNWVPLLGSDAHHLSTDGHVGTTEAKAPGTHLTMVKAETLDLQGLRLALTDPDESLQRVRRGYRDPNEVSHGHINSLEVRHEGQTKSYKFGPWMNCLIGGRGVGKSTLIELLRLALGRSYELPSGVAREVSRFSPEANGDERWWNAESEIVVNYTKDQRLLRVTWKGSDPEHSSIELWAAEEWLPQSGRVVDRAPVRIFSQKQIYELASTPQSFLTILDDMPSIRHKEWVEEYKALELQFKTERNKLRQLLSESEKADRIRGELEEVRGRLQHLEELRASDEYRELDRIEALLREADLAEAAALKIERDVIEQAAALRSLLGTAAPAQQDTVRTASFGTAATLLEQASKVLADGRTVWETSEGLAQWKSRVSELTQWLDAKGGNLVASSERTAEDRQREAELEIELRTVENSDRRRADQEAVIDGVMAQIVAKRVELFERRKKFVRTLSSSDGALTKVDIFHQGEVDTLGDALRQLLGFPESFDNAFGAEGFPSILAQHEPRSPKFPSCVAEFKKKLEALVEHGIASDIGAAVKIDARFYTRLSNADTFDLVTDIWLWFPDDLISVLYRPEPGGNLIPVDRGSPGQKTAALLTVILQMGSEPLLLDQPEDDLENKLIRRLAVATLKQIKRDRQLLVSTHNANVVVTSGAENIMVLQHGALPVVEAEGTLQRETVRENVCEILEGGEEAIRTRYDRLVGA